MIAKAITINIISINSNDYSADLARTRQVHATQVNSLQTSLF